MSHKVYKAIITAIKSGELIEPFSNKDFMAKCTGFGKGTYNAFLYKHSKGNRGGNSELFKKVARGQFQCIRPFKYGLGDD